MFRIERTGGLSLQEQIRANIITAIDRGVFPTGYKLPSSRELAEALGLSRNTILLAYQRLIDDGHLVSRERSGVFVANSVRRPGSGAIRIAGRSRSNSPSLASQRLSKAHNRPAPRYQCPPDWQRYPYPFI